VIVTGLPTLPLVLDEVGAGIVGVACVMVTVAVFEVLVA
jgi:hypothetical protein